MFDFVAKHKRVLQIILGITIIPFAFFGLQTYTKSFRGSDDVAQVDGTPVSKREFEDELRRQQDRLRAVIGPDADVSQFDTPEFRRNVLDALITRHLMLEQVATGRLAESRRQVVAQLLAAPDFQENGKFSQERYLAYLRMRGLSDEANVAMLQLELPAARLAGAIADTAFQPRTVAERMIALESQQREVAEAQIPAAPLEAQVKPDAAALKAYYDANQIEFRQPERVRAEYVVLSAEQLGRDNPPTEAELKAAYDAHASQYGVAEQRRASHILVKTKEEAEKIAAEAREHPDGFAALAKKYSQDTGSAAQGGDLSWSDREGLASKALADAIFSMKEGEISGPVKSEFGWHVIKLTGIRPAHERPFDEMKAALAAQLEAQQGQKKFAELAEPFGNIVYEQSDSLKPAADKYHLKVEQSGWLTRQPDPALGVLASPKLLAALFSDDSLRQKRNTDAIEVKPGVLVAARVLEHQAEKLRPFDEVKAEVERRVVRRDAAALARKQGEAKLALLQKGEDAGLQWGAPKTVSRRAPAGLSPAAVQRVMTVPAAKLPAYAGVERGEQGYAIYRVSKVIEAAPADPQKNAAEFAGLDRAAGAAQFDAYVAGLRASAKIEIDQENLLKKQ